MRGLRFIRRAESGAWELRGRRGTESRFAECLRTQDYAIVVQIETVAGVKNAEAIVGHAAVDAVVIGPYDLSGSFGVPGRSGVVAGGGEHCRGAGAVQGCRKAMRDFRGDGREGEACTRRQGLT